MEEIERRVKLDGKVVERRGSRLDRAGEKKEKDGIGVERREKRMG